MTFFCWQLGFLTVVTGLGLAPLAQGQTQDRDTRHRRVPVRVSVPGGAGR